MATVWQIVFKVDIDNGRIFLGGWENGSCTQVIPAEPDFSASRAL